MKTKTIKKLAKKVTASFLAMALIVAGVVICPTKGVEAATNTGTDVQSEFSFVAKADVQYITVDEEKIPTLDGYLFAGWYDSNDSEKAKTALASSENATYAKFVPSYILSVKAQNYKNTTRTGSATTTTRIVTSVDSDQFKEVGFNIIKEDGTTKSYATTKVYSSLNVIQSDDSVKSYEPNVLFGDKAKYCAVLELKNIPEDSWDENTYIQPYWVTEDGTTVTGLPKYVRVDDGLDGYISVAVNLKTGEDVAAGVVNVKYDNTKLEFAGYYAGKVFEEMEVADKGDSVKCVGNVEDITSDIAANDMYISLRFKNNGYTIGSGDFLNFEMTDIDFANTGEQLTETDVWDVQY